MLKNIFMLPKFLSQVSKGSSGNFLFFLKTSKNLAKNMSVIKSKTMTKTVKTYPGKFEKNSGKNLAFSQEFPAYKPNLL